MNSNIQLAQYKNVDLWKAEPTCTNNLPIIRLRSGGKVRNAALILFTHGKHGNKRARKRVPQHNTFPNIHRAQSSQSKVFCRDGGWGRNTIGKAIGSQQKKCEHS